MTILRKTVLVVGMSVVVLLSSVSGGVISDSTFVFLRPEMSSFWNTATNNAITLPIDYPAGAASASLTVSGLKYFRLYEDLTGPYYDLQLPAPESPETENVYELTLSFDDGTTRTAKLGLIQGLGSGGKGSTRCLVPAHNKAWGKVNGRAVLPIPYGTTSFTINDIAIDPGLGGAQGWYALGGVDGGESCSLELDVDGIPYLATLTGSFNGSLIMLR